MVLYASETWFLTAEDIQRIEAKELWIWRRIEKINWTDRVSNEEMLQRVNKKRQILSQNVQQDG